MRSITRIALAMALSAAAAGSMFAGNASSAGFTADLVGTNGSEPFSCGLLVTNKGPATAHNVYVVTSPGLFGPGPVSLGDIAPGESKKKLQIDCGIYGRDLYQSAVSTTPDLKPGNNGATVFQVRPRG